MQRYRLMTSLARYFDKHTQWLPKITLRFVSLLTIAVIIVVIFLILNINHRHLFVPRFVSRDVFQASFSRTGSTVTCRRTSLADDDADRKLCRPLYGGAITRRTTNHSALLKVRWKQSSDDDYVTCTADCNRFRSAFGYVTSVDDVTKEEREFPLAFRLVKQIITLFVNRLASLWQC